MPEGFERGLEKIKKGQNAIITLSPKYAYGEAGSEDMGVPGNATVQYVVNVNEVVPTEGCILQGEILTCQVTPTYQLQLKDKLAAAEKRKEQGNGCHPWLFPVV